MDEENFLFSLCQNDLIRIESKRTMKFKVQNSDSTLEKEAQMNCGLTYFEGGNISTGAITVTTHDNAYIVGSLGFKTLQRFKSIRSMFLVTTPSSKKKNGKPSLPNGGELCPTAA